MRFEVQIYSPNLFYGSQGRLGEFNWNAGQPKVHQRPTWLGPSIFHHAHCYMIQPSALSNVHSNSVAMARLLNLISIPTVPFPSLPVAPARAFFTPSRLSPAVRFSGKPSASRALRVVTTRAGPSANSYIFAFSIPLSLILVTVLAALKIGDNLDKKFLEEVLSDF